MNADLKDKVILITGASGGIGAATARAFAAEGAKLVLHCHAHRAKAEQLAGELGLYSTTLEDLAHLDLELLRACRVVIDTGIHSLGWSMDEAAAYYETERGSPAGSQYWAMGRYVDFPGQGLSYPCRYL